MISLLEQKQALADTVLFDGEVSEMDLPSGRLAFMERLEKLIDMPIIALPTPEANAVIPEKETLQKFTVDVINQCQGNLQALEKHAGTHEKPVLIAVVKQVGDDTCEHLKQNLKANNLKNFDLAVLDEKTQALLNQLAELGVITINKPTEQLFVTPSIAATQRKAQLERIHKAQKHFEQANRKLKMAELLIEGDLKWFPLSRHFFSKI